MVTTSITIAPHLAQYAKAIFNVPGESYIQVPRTEDLYHIVSSLMQKKPKDYELTTEGNLTIALPHRDKGKNPHVYSHLSERSAQVIEKKIQALFWAHLHEFIDEYRHKIRREDLGAVFYIKDCVHIFMQKFSITEITEGALVKNYSRWKDSVRRQLKKRGYTLAEKPKKQHI